MFVVQGIIGKYAALNGLIFEELPFPEKLTSTDSDEVVDTHFLKQRAILLLSPALIRQACFRVKRNPASDEVLSELSSRSDDFIFGIQHTFCVELLR